MTQEKHPFKIEISKRLREVLLEFETESVIARLLLSKEDGELVADPINFISVSEEDKTKISYLSTDRVEKIKKNWVGHPHQDRETEYALWHSPIRVFARPGSFISKIFKNIPPSEIEKFSNLYRANVNKPRFKLKVVTGENLREFYNYETYAGEGRGTLGNSCMKHEACQRFFNIYVDNKDVVSMLVMLDDNDMLMGRALLWNYESYKIMDRIYTICDEELAFYFKKWATDNGYLYKSEQNWYNTLFFESLGNKKQELKIDIKLKYFDHSRYPYVDTFKWINLQTGTIHNYIPKLEDNSYLKTLVASDGGRLDWNYIILDDLDKMFRYRNECAFCSYLNIWTHQNNMSFSEINNQWILNKDVVYDEDISDNIFNSEYNHLNNKEMIDEKRKLIAERRERRRIEDEKRYADRERRQRDLVANIGRLSDNPEYAEFAGMDMNNIISVISDMGIGGIGNLEQAFNRTTRRRVRPTEELTPDTDLRETERVEEPVVTATQTAQPINDYQSYVSWRRTDDWRRDSELTPEDPQGVLNDIDSLIDDLSETSPESEGTDSESEIFVEV